MVELLFEELTHQIIGAYYDVFNNTGREYPEYVYESALEQELLSRRIPCRRQLSCEVQYKDQSIGAQRLDLLVAEKVIVELKVNHQLSALNDAQLLSYLKVFDKKVGLLCNYGGAAPEFKRLIGQAHPVPPARSQPERLTDAVSPRLLEPELVYTVLGALYEVHSHLGPGFMRNLYANACYRELQERGIPAQPRRKIQVLYRNEPVASIPYAHIQIGRQILLFPEAISDINRIRFGNLRAWLRTVSIPLGIVANFHELSLRPVILKAWQDD